MTESPLPEGTRPPSKREQIHELLRLGHSTKHIAETLHTTPENIWKEKSILKAKGIFGTKQSGVPSSSVSSSPAPASQNDMLGESLQNKDNDRFNAMSARPPDYKELYQLFQKGWRPISIILQSKFSPETVENEYDRFLKFRRMDRNPIQIMLDILPHENRNDGKAHLSTEGNNIWRTFSKYGYLNIGDIKRLLKSKLIELSREDFEGGIDWKTITCTKCSQKQDNVFVDPDGRVGRNDSGIVKIDGCHLCVGVEYDTRTPG
jgi:hypothetical protein